MTNIHNQDEKVQRYIEIDGEQILVTEEVYRAYKRPLWAEHKRKERASDAATSTASAVPMTAALATSCAKAMFCRSTASSKTALKWQTRWI
ncbi:hypothetical protein AGMMS49983_04610 [Clostridia bacterium]|nr:hypothetical protein AGMMS49983_04610 [Clostridia bacterium]